MTHPGAGESHRSIDRTTLASAFAHPVAASSHSGWQSFDSRRWARWLVRLTRWRTIHRDGTVTWEDRYPQLFGRCRDLMGSGDAHLVLSFGCSSGEEAVTFRRYVPRAKIVCNKLDPVELAACHVRPHDIDVAFI